MANKLLIFFIICLCVSCAKSTSYTPGKLGIQFSGMWGKQPNMVVQRKPYPFLIRLTGLITPEAYMVITLDEFGKILAHSQITYNDAMQISPVRNYQFVQRLTQEICNELQLTNLKNSSNSKLIIEDSLIDTGIWVELTALVLSQTNSELAKAQYSVFIQCALKGLGT